MSETVSECVECGDNDTIHHHHISYERDEIVPLCPSCHRTVHHNENHELYPIDENPNNETTIRLTASTRDRLRAAKQGGESYDELINRILEEVIEE